MLEAVRLYVEALVPYRTLARLISARTGRTISATTINSWLLELAHMAMSTLEVSTRLSPNWGGFLGADGKSIWVAGKEHCLFLGVDHPTQDLVHALVLEAETSAGYVRLITELIRDADYPIKGVTSDFGPGFLKSHQDYFGDLPFQACRIHFERRLEKHIPKAKGTPDADVREELRSRLRDVVFAENEQRARTLFDEIVHERSKYGRYGSSGPTRHLQMYFEAYVAHFRVPGLPADNNVTENVIKQLSKKLRLMEGFQSLESAEAFIRLATACYRFKRFTGSKNRASNGRSPLEIAGVDLRGTDWLTFILNHNV